MKKTLRNIFISWYDKTSLEPLLEVFKQNQLDIVASDGTAAYLRSHDIACTSVSEWTGSPPIIGGRVKTLHPLVFGSILARSDDENDVKDIELNHLKPFDAVLVELYPFEKAFYEGAAEDQLIEMIDVGGVSLIRAAAKNFSHTLVVSSVEQLPLFKELLLKGYTTIEERRFFAVQAFFRTTRYDAMIYQWFSNMPTEPIVLSSNVLSLRYGENPDQKGYFVGDMSTYLEILQGKTLSFNNVLDISAALNLLQEFEEPTAVVIKHGNACGVASSVDENLVLPRAIDSDPVSAFGGIIAKNRTIKINDAQLLSKMFFEILIAPDFSDEAISWLAKNEKRILIRLKQMPKKDWQWRETLFGYLVQTTQHVSTSGWKLMAGKPFNDAQLEDAKFGVKVVKHLSSNAIVIAKNKQLIGVGMGQPNRVDAVRHAIEKAKKFGFTLEGSVLVSDGFFPFADSITLAEEHGIRHIVEPGGSVRDNDIIQYCREKKISLIFTHQRLFKH